MDSEFAVDAAYARRDFKWNEKHQKPEFVDYVLEPGNRVLLRNCYLL